MSIKINPEVEKMIQYLFDDTITIEDIIKYLNNQLPDTVRTVDYRGGEIENDYNVVYGGLLKTFNENNEIHGLKIVLSIDEDLFITKSSKGFLYYTTWYDKYSQEGKSLTELTEKLNALIGR